MALTPSNMMPLATRAPSFQLPDTITGRDFSLDELKGKLATVIMFICNHCPYVKHVQEQQVTLANDYSATGVSFIAISSNDVDAYPEDSPEMMLKEAKKWKYPFPYLYDETQMVARKYDVACTPDYYIFDKSLDLVYRGQLDDSRPGNGLPVSGSDIRQALDDIIKGNPVSDDQKPSVGCSMKWK